MAYLSAGFSRKRYFFERFCSLFPKRRIPTERQNTCNFQTGKQTAKHCSLQGRPVIGALFRLPEGEAYPEYGSEMTVTGTFGSYFEGNNEYYLLTDAKVDNYSSSPNFLQ
ncbi:MAG: hypothetical protein IJR45_04550 [Firmicutes bacterium]|nr:hypothetical protein [Bacillota bacterium]